MRLKLKNEKCKISFIYYFIGCFVALVVLYNVRLNVFAASSGGSSPSYYTEYPLPYGVGTGYGYDSSVVDISTAFNSVYTYATTQLWSGGQISGIYVYEYNSSANRLDLFVTMVSTADTPNMPSFSPNPQSYPTVSSGDTFSCSDINFSYIVSCFLSDYHCEWIISGNITNVNIGSSWTTSLPTNISVVAPDNFYYGYPLYIYGNPDIVSAGGRIGLTYGSPSGGNDDAFSIIGSAVGKVTDGNGNESDVDLDIIFNYDDSNLVNKLDSIEEGINDLNDKQDDTNNWLERIWQAITDYFAMPDPDDITDTLEDYPVINDFIGTTNEIRSTIDDIFDFDSIQPKTASDVDFDYTFHWSVYQPSFASVNPNTSRSGSGSVWVPKSTTVRIVLSWYESVRTPCMLVLSTFLVLGFCVYLFKQIPSIINGAGSGIEATRSLSDHLSNRGGKK